MTPTGAALASTLADEFGPLPAMRLEAIGYGAGTRELRGARRTWCACWSASATRSDRRHGAR